MKHFALIPLAALALSGCMTMRDNDGSGSARFGQTARVGDLRVTPLRLLEDSRCPQGVQCVWAGQVRIGVSVSSGSRVDFYELTQSKPVTVSRGQLVLAEVTPPRLADRSIRLQDYRFTFDYLPER